ncbi:Formamidopyrimidine-DNA glycosylase [Anaerolineae bacterium]|nr:Formamidopyrimidine-DNA glycosylase [Anaerolineae bacterium]
MPELPEVETVVRALRPVLVGRTICTAEFPAPPRRMVNLPPEALQERISGQTIRALNRRAKYLLFELSRDHLVVHLKMTGHLYVLSPDQISPFDKWVRVRFPLDDGRELRFSDSRRFGRVYLAGEAAEVLPELGPEPLEESFTLSVFKARLKGRERALKPLLLDQSFIAGVGNIYADEALHLAQIHPQRTAKSLSQAEIKRLYDSVRHVLQEGIRHQGATIGWYRSPDGKPGEAQNHLRVYRTRATKDVPCPVCGSPISVIPMGQRSTHFCPVCQPETKEGRKK